ncbi:hypothetical protein MLD38_029625 [Melastoma candidum]|uniref:Uncharacterized protein n=1 Tax=Melastoma candidum TaxID=119954 RepID=A0ACB9N4A9_9MYRT|nr:hypothetical protein MLD38_029625 [Melastoma candidum]
MGLLLPANISTLVVEFARKVLKQGVEMSIPLSISRVNQFDAARLDVEMSAMLKEQLVKAFSLMKPGMLFQYEPELDAFLEFLIWQFSIWVDKPMPGIGLMNLRYTDAAAPVERGISEQAWKDQALLLLRNFGDVPPPLWDKTPSPSPPQLSPPPPQSSLPTPQLPASVYPEDEGGEKDHGSNRGNWGSEGGGGGSTGAGN